ncbi:hypothetical protein BB558_001419 [Smittium angustum]|uniref:Transcription factor domain-containing protein n=1 Tax=Smittium angustum TaxID=133377 RepID=A0A2U1JBU0_SMIAN|nr:hypothetical protein BB558_001419 [Smittium angustum]
MPSNQFEYSNSLFTDTIHGLPIPNKEKLQELSLILPHVFPETMIPMRIPEFINKLTNKKYPYYFIFAVLAAGIKYIKPTRNESDKQLEAKYAAKSIELIRKETDISDPLIIWACIFIIGYTYGISSGESSVQATDIAAMAVKNTRLYQLDINKNLIKFKYGYTEDDLEFRRRIWWLWRKNGFDEDGANQRLVLYINQLHRLKDKMDETLGDGFPTIVDKYKIYKGTAKLILETEGHIINHNLRHIYYSMYIYLYQSELVRDPNIKIRPERVKAAKQQCVHASIKQMELLEWYSQNVPSEYKGFPHIAYSLNSLLCLTNFFFIQDPSLKEKHTDCFNRIVTVYKSFDKNSYIVSRFLFFVNYIIGIKTKASKNNKKYTHLQDYMKPFGISDHDLEPWVIPKYGSYFHSFCCAKANFSTLDIGEYLGEILPAENFDKDEQVQIQLGIRKSPANKDKEKLNDGYLSQINRTILDLTSNFQIKKSIVFDTSFGIEDFFHKKPLAFDPSFLMVNREFPKSNKKPQKDKKIHELKEPFQQPTKSFKSNQNPKRKRNNFMRVESLLN